MVYIREAHAEDGRAPVPYARELGIREHKNLTQRCETAQRLIDDKKLTLPCLIDDMKDTANKGYSAWPDRVFIIRKDGRIAVAAERGPWGFEGGLRAAREWLAAFKKDGTEPPLPESEAPADKDRGGKEGRKEKSAGSEQSGRKEPP